MDENNENALVTLKQNLESFVNLLRDTNTNINQMELIDTPLEDWFDMISKSSKVLGGIVKIYNFSEKIIFIKFLKGLSSKINNENAVDPETNQKLNYYLSKEKNIEFVYSSIRKSLTANSLICTELLAIIVGDILQNQIEMNLENITIIDALHSLNDFDLFNFCKIYKTIKESNESKMRLDKLYSIIKKEEIQLSLYKLINLQLLNQELITTQQGVRWGEPLIDPLNKVMKDNEKFIFINNISPKLYELIQESHVQF